MDEQMKAEKRESERGAERRAGGGADGAENPTTRAAGAAGEPGAERTDVEGEGGGGGRRAADGSGSASSVEDVASAEGEEAVEVSEAGDAAGEREGDEAELASLQSELESLNERHLRLAAEFDNYRKRIGREREALRTRAQADLVRGLLEVLDDLQRVAEYETETASAEALLEGVELVEKKFRHALATAGLEPIQAEGEFFNPNTMEALMTVPAEHPEEDDVVADVFQKGYRFGDTLIRPARVRVKKYEQSG
ncbi:MAG: nucleotide exchange factor GrpE [Gemmatimonadota bacterium]